MFKLGLDRPPLDRATDLATAPTFSRLENAATVKDIYRMAKAFVDQFIASYAAPPAVIVLDMDHCEDATYGQQEFSFYNHHYRSHCYLPLFLFEGLSGRFITAALRPGKRPKGAENAMIIKRVLKRLRTAWPQTRIVLRGDGHFANPQLMPLARDDPHTDFLFGRTGNPVLARMAQPLLDAHRQHHAVRCETARRLGQPAPQRTRTYHEVDDAAGSWPQAFRAMLKNDLASDRTSDHRFLANHLRLFFACAAYVLHQTLRTEVLVHTELAKAQPSTVIVKLFKPPARRP